MFTIPQENHHFYRWYKLTIPSPGWFIITILPTLIGFSMK